MRVDATINVSICCILCGTYHEDNISHRKCRVCNTTFVKVNPKDRCCNTCIDDKRWLDNCQRCGRYWNGECCSLCKRDMYFENMNKGN